MSDLISKYIGRIGISTLKLMIEKDASFWEFIESQDDFYSLKITYKMFKALIHTEKFSAEKVLEYAKGNNYPHYDILNSKRGRIWLNNQVIEIKENLSKI